MKDALGAADVADPFDLFRAWYEAAAAAGQPLPGAMSLSTAGGAGQPASRMVLLSLFDRRGFVFHTNYESRKGSELSAQPRVALLFWWASVDRQVRIEGEARRTDPGESDAYFAGRPRGSQIGAWASDQSRPLPGRETLDRRVREVLARFADVPVPRPPHWGGFRVVPGVFEFWRGREDRLHDRLRFDLVRGRWTATELYP
ncbi:MAG: pyridoxamine 5'-phosphate oxidase [Verrucomicrobiota bacterium]